MRNKKLQFNNICPRAAGRVGGGKTNPFETICQGRDVFQQAAVDWGKVRRSPPDNVLLAFLIGLSIMIA